MVVSVVQTHKDQWRERAGPNAAESALFGCFQRQSGNPSIKRQRCGQPPYRLPCCVPMFIIMLPTSHDDVQKEKLQLCWLRERAHHPLLVVYPCLKPACTHFIWHGRCFVLTPIRLMGGGSSFRQKLLSYRRDFCTSCDLLLNFGLTFSSMEVLVPLKVRVVLVVLSEY